jgi:hypothetical protein
MGANYFLIPERAVLLVQRARALASKAERGALWREASLLFKAPVHLGRSTCPSGGPLFIWNITPEEFELASSDGPGKCVVVHETDEGRVPSSWTEPLEFLEGLERCGARHDYEHAGKGVWFR